MNNTYYINLLFCQFRCVKLLLPLDTKCYDRVLNHPHPHFNKSVAICQQVISDLTFKSSFQSLFKTTFIGKIICLAYYFDLAWRMMTFNISKVLYMTWGLGPNDTGQPTLICVGCTNGPVPLGELKMQHIYYIFSLHKFN